MYQIYFLSSSFIEKIIRIHKSALPDDVLPNIGNGFLTDYYKMIVSDKSQLLFGCFIKEDLAGYCQVSMKPISILKIAIYPRTILSILRLVFQKPKIFITGLIQLLRMQHHENRIAEISFIAVLPEFQGKGIGKALIDFANYQVRANGINLIRTKTNNPIMKNIYLSHYGAKVSDSFSLMGKNFTWLTWSVLHK